MVFLPLFEGRYAFSHQRVEHDRMRFVLDLLSCFQSPDDRSNIVAVDSLGIPSKGLPLAVDRLDVKHLRGRTVRLLIVAIDKREKVVEAVMRGCHGAFPCRAFLQLAVREQIEDAGRAPIEAST